MFVLKDARYITFVLVLLLNLLFYDRAWPIFPTKLPRVTITESTSVYSEERPPSGGVESRSVNYVYVGDSRVRQLYEAHLKHLKLLNRQRYSLSACNENAFRYKHPTTCSESELSVMNKQQRVMLRECWRSDLACFQQLAAGAENAMQYLTIDQKHNFRVIMNFGLHDALYLKDTSFEKNFFQRLDEIFKIFHRLKNVELIWFSPFPLFPPEEGKTAKFASWATENSYIKEMAQTGNAIARKHNVAVLDISEFISPLVPTMSPDTVHPSAAIMNYLFHELLSLVDDHEILLAKVQPESILREFKPELDVSCGCQSTTVLRNLEHINVAFFGGSVTADFLYVTSFQQNAVDIINKTVSTINFGEPATDASYQSMCIEHSLGQELGRVDIVVVEYCVNELYAHTSNLELLIRKILRMIPKPLVVYYCHVAPRNRFSGLVSEAHLSLSKRFGLMTFSNSYMMSAMLKNSPAEKIMFRDEVHLTHEGGTMIAQLLLKTLAFCSSAHEPIEEGKSTCNISSASPSVASSMLSHDQCFTALGPESHRNLREIVQSSSWPFVEQQHRSAPNGKNGYETAIDKTCILFSLNLTCSESVSLFYLLSSQKDMGLVEVTHSECPKRVQIISGYHDIDLSIVSRVELNMTRLPECCSNTPQQVQISMCSRQRVTAASRFRIIALGVRLGNANDTQIER